MQETLLVTKENMQDILQSYTPIHRWKELLPSLFFSDKAVTVLMNHPAINSFKFFTLSPASLYYYIDGSVVERGTMLVRTKTLEPSDNSAFYDGIDPKRSCLFGVFKTGTEIKIRYAVTDHDIYIA